MQSKQKKNMGMPTAAILITGCFMLTAAFSAVAQENKIELDFTKIRQALNKNKPETGMTSTPAYGVSGRQMTEQGTAPISSADTMEVGPGVIGTMDEELNKVMTETMQDTVINSDIMVEMQRKVMAENMSSIQESIQSSVMENVRNSVQQGAAQTATERIEQ